jgi:hypothetical protein
VPRYHEIILAFEGECALCGGCCAGCDRLYRKAGKWLCRDHPDEKPGHCHLFPLGYAKELLPESCCLVPTEVVRIDETLQTGRMRVSGRAGPSLFAPVAKPDDDDGEKRAEDHTLYDIQAQVECADEEEVYRDAPEHHLAKMARAVEELRAIELAADTSVDRPLSWDAAARTEALSREILRALCLYATRRDIILGDLFTD